MKTPVRKKVLCLQSSGTSFMDKTWIEYNESLHPANIDDQIAIVEEWEPERIVSSNRRRKRKEIKRERRRKNPHRIFFSVSFVDQYPQSSLSVFIHLGYSFHCLLILFFFRSFCLLFSFSVQSLFIPFVSLSRWKEARRKKASFLFKFFSFLSRLIYSEVNKPVNCNKIIILSFPANFLSLNLYLLFTSSSLSSLTLFLSFQ